MARLRVRQDRRLIPELRDGDRLSTNEFMRRYKATPAGFRAELINGVVFVNRWIEVGPNGNPRVVPFITAPHGQAHAELMGILGHYSVFTPGLRGSAPSTILLSPKDSVAEPDVSVHVLPEYGGRCRIGRDDFLRGAPELIGEIVTTLAGIELGPKFEMYECNGVQEYIVWRTRQKVIDWFHLNSRREYAPLTPDADGVLKSRVFPGLWLDPVAMTGGQMTRVLDVVRQGIASPEHAKFVEKLSKRAAKKKR